MRLRDRISSAVRAVREYPSLRADLGAAEYERNQAEQALEQKTRDCEHLQGMMEAAGHRLRFAECRAAALSSALREFVPELSGIEEMKRFYETLAPSLDAGGYTLYRMAEQVTGETVYSLFPYEDSRGAFEHADGRELLRYLTAGYLGAVDWQIVPGTIYEKASLQEVDRASPEYQQFEEQLYRTVLVRMGFEDILAPEPAIRQELPLQAPTMR